MRNSFEKKKNQDVTTDIKKQVLVQWEEMPENIRDEMVRSVRADQLHNQEAEQMVLGAILGNKAAYFLTGNLKPSDFYFEHHVEIFADIEMLMAQGKIPNPITLGAKYDCDPMFEDLGGKKYLLDLIMVTTHLTLDVGQYSDIIKDLSNRRKLISALKSLSEKILAPSATEVAEDLKAFVLSEILAIDDGKKGRRIASLREVAEQVNAEMDNFKEPDTTGISELDKALAGGLYPTKVYDFPALMKTGKTMLMATIYTNVMLSIQREMANDQFAREQGHSIPYRPVKPVLYIAAEMGQLEITQRIVARMIDANSLHFLTKRSDDDFRERVKSFVASGADLPGYFYDASLLRFSELQYIMNVAVKRQKVRGVFLDSFNLVVQDPTPKIRFENQTAFKEHLANWIKSFCKENDIWCVTTNQINSAGKIRGGDAESMFFDAILQLDRNLETDEAWLTCKQMRYAPPRHAGDKKSPCMKVEKAGPHFSGIMDSVKAATKEALQKGWDPLESIS